MYDFQTHHQNALAPGKHSSLSYQDVYEAGPATQPLDFPTPRVKHCKTSSSKVMDHITGLVHYIEKIIVPLPDEDNAGNRAYLMKKKIAKTTYASVRLCVVLKRRCTFGTLESGEAQWISTGELVIIKASSWDRMKQLRGKHLEDPIKEVSALQYIGGYHPNLITCREALQDEEYLYQIMDYHAGGDLAGRILVDKLCTKQITRRYNLPVEDQVRIWFRQLLEALHHLQKKGVCHRDISLQNLLLDDELNLVLVDFGLALRVPYTDKSNLDRVADVSEGFSRRLMLAQGQGGDLQYLAPEVIERQPFDGFAIDLWAAGIVLFVMLTGTEPFKWAHPSDFRYAQICKGQLNQVVQNCQLDLPESACQLLQNMFWRDPRKRLTLEEVMEHPWVRGPDVWVPPTVRSKCERLSESSLHMFPVLGEHMLGMGRYMNAQRSADHLTSC